MPSTTATTVLTTLKLTNLYDRHAPIVLAALLKALPRQKRQMQKFEVIGTLPTLEEYRAMRDRRFSQTVESLLADGVGELETLGDELEEWYDQLPENLQNGDKANTLQEGMDVLHSLDSTASDWLQEAQWSDIANLSVVHLPLPNINSRSMRRDEAVSMLEDVQQAVQERLDTAEDYSYNEGQQEQLQEFIDAVQEMIDQANDVEFPSMFGA